MSNIAEFQPKKRFSSRVENYVRYRPGYPGEAMEHLKKYCGLTPRLIVADIGSGTGILSEYFLKNGNRVYGVEPNPQMRAAAEKNLKKYPEFISVPGSAEETTLPDRSVDLIVAGQAFHWFQPEAARREFRRILKPGRFVALIWNIRNTTGTPFLQKYEALLHRFAPEYTVINRNQVNSAALKTFFGRQNFSSKNFTNRQKFDYPSLKGRLLSSSYTPLPGEPSHKPMLDRLRKIFEEFSREGVVEFLYETHLIFGKL